MSRSRNEKGRMVRRLQVYVLDVWMECRECEFQLPWDEFYVDNDKKSGKRAICIECSKDQHTGWHERKIKALLEAQEKYGGIAFTYTLVFSQGAEHVEPYVYVGFTTQAPKYRFAQHIGASHNNEIKGYVDMVKDSEAERFVFEKSNIPHSGVADLKGNLIFNFTDCTQSLNLPDMNVFAHSSVAEAALAEQEMYDRLSHPHIPVVLVNKIRPYGKVAQAGGV